MIGDDIPERLRAAIAAAIVNTSRIEKECAARGSDVHEGELYLFRAESSEIILWCTALQHPDEARLMYAVPADNCSLIGVPDVALPDDAPCGPLSIRCGLGLWLDDESFRSARRIGILDEPSLKLVQDQLAGLASGQLEGTDLQFEEELNPEYEEQLARIADELDWLEGRFAGPRVVFPIISPEIPYVPAAFPIVSPDSPSSPVLLMKAAGSGHHHDPLIDRLATRLPSDVPTDDYRKAWAHFLASAFAGTDPSKWRDEFLRLIGGASPLSDDWGERKRRAEDLAQDRDWKRRHTDKGAFTLEPRSLSNRDDLIRWLDELMTPESPPEPRVP